MGNLEDFEKLILKSFIEENWAMFLQHCEAQDVGELSAEEICRKLDLEAAVIRSSTQARLDREIQGDTSVFEHYPYQVLSVDYIKQETRRDTFIHQCPELVIVDEVHSCACPAGAPVSQQQRHSLLCGISAKKG